MGAKTQLILSTRNLAMVPFLVGYQNASGHLIWLLLKSRGK